MGESSELFVNCLEAIIASCLPADDPKETTEAPITPKAHSLSVSLNSLSMNSPTEKGKYH